MFTYHLHYNEKEEKEPWKKCKKPKVRTRDMWGAIHRTKDVQKCYTQNEHVKRVLTREGTPWIQHSIVPSFTKRKDPFVQKYQILLNHLQKEKERQVRAERMREKVYENVIAMQEQQTSGVPPTDFKDQLKHHFDNYIQALLQSKSRVQLELLNDEAPLAIREQDSLEF